MLAQWECPWHGDRLSTCNPNGMRWCEGCVAWVDPVEVEYVRADIHERAVEALREVDRVCTLGAERLGMSPDGVTALRGIAQRIIGEQVRP
jgi:hypothetical protein